MSDESSVLSRQHFDYVAARTRPDDEFLNDLKREAALAGIPEIWVSPEQASFMRILMKLHATQHLVEVGTLAGYSAISFARGMQPGGRVTSIELDPRCAAFARERIAKSDVADRVHVIEGDAREVLPTLAEDSADAIFIDADKAGYPVYFEQGCRIVRSGGLILADNAFAFGQLLSEHPTDPGVGAIRAFNNVVAADDRVDAVIVPIGDGLWVGTLR